MSALKCDIIRPKILSRSYSLRKSMLHDWVFFHITVFSCISHDISPFSPFWDFRTWSRLIEGQCVSHFFSKRVRRIAKRALGTFYVIFGECVARSTSLRGLSKIPLALKFVQFNFLDKGETHPLSFSKYSYLTKYQTVNLVLFVLLY